MLRERKAFYTIVYAPVLWLEEKFGMAHTSAAGLESA